MVFDLLLLKDPLYCCVNKTDEYRLQGCPANPLYFVNVDAQHYLLRTWNDKFNKLVYTV